MISETNVAGAMMSMFEPKVRSCEKITTVIGCVERASVSPTSRSFQEEVQCPRVDRDLRFPACVCGGVRAKAPDDRRAGGLVGQLLADVGGELTDVVGERRTSVDVEVRDDLGAEPLAEDDRASQPSVWRRLRDQRCVLQVFRIAAVNPELVLKAVA